MDGCLLFFKTIGALCQCAWMDRVSTNLSMGTICLQMVEMIGVRQERAISLDGIHRAVNEITKF